MPILYHIIAIPLIIFLLVVTYLSWFGKEAGNIYERHSKYIPMDWISKETFIKLHKIGILVTLLLAVGIYIYEILSG